MSGAATVFTVRDVGLSIRHYQDQLGFDVTFQYGDPLSYACLCRDEVGLHLRAAGSTKIPGQAAICIFVTDVDSVYKELAARGANVVKPPSDQDYGMRDFNVVDPDGNQLVFGMSSAKRD